MMHSVIIDLRIPAQEYLKVYEGAAESVLVRARDGRKIRFPAHILKRFITRSGIEGSFVIDFDQRMKFQSIRRL